MQVLVCCISINTSIGIIIDINANNYANNSINIIVNTSVRIIMLYLNRGIEWGQISYCDLYCASLYVSLITYSVQHPISLMTHFFSHITPCSLFRAPPQC